MLLPLATAPNHAGARRSALSIARALDHIHGHLGERLPLEDLVQDGIEAALRQVAQGVALASGTTITVHYERYYPATVNTACEAELALAAAAAVGLRTSVAAQPAFTSEDFAFMLRACPGAYLWLGQGRGGSDDAPLHHPRYDFNDDALGHGVAWLVEVAQRALAPSGVGSR